MEHDFTQTEGFETAQNVPAIYEDEKFIMDLTAERKVDFCTFIPKTEKEKKLLFNAMNNPEKRIGDCINETINIKDVFCEIVNCTNKDTGDVTICPRIVLINEKGVGYQAVSLGIYSALKKIFRVFGMPNEWSSPLKIKVIQVTKGERKMLTLNVVD